MRACHAHPHAAILPPARLGLASLALAFMLGGASPAGASECPRMRWIWLLYERDRRGPVTSIAIRPFYVKTGTPSSYYEGSLMPLLVWHYHSERKDQWRWLFWFGESVNYMHSDGKRDFDFGFFPLLFFGKGDDPSERYFMLWPFGGTLKHKFGTDKISAFVFPGLLLFVFFPPASIFSYTTLAYILASMIPVVTLVEQGDYRSWSVFWPLVTRGKSPLRDDLRILPFFSRLTKKGWYDRISVLMVFNYSIHHFRDDWLKSFFFFPLVGRKWSRSGRMSSWALLWPFFSWGRDERIGDRQLNLFWPLVQIRDCNTPRIHSRILFPFFGRHRYEKNETLFFTPLYFRLSKSSYRFDSMQWIIGGIVMYYKRDYHNRPDPYYGRKWRYFKIWPLFHVERNDSGDFAFNLLSMLPFRDREGYEKLYAPFWTIVEYERFAGGEKRLGLFFRLYYQRWTANEFQMRIAFLLGVSRREKKLTELSFFESMFGYACGGRGKFVRIFWIPVRIGKGCDCPDAEPGLPDVRLGGDYVMPPRDPLANYASASCRF